MATLVIHDLPESLELDRQAMAAITGGAMVQAHHTLFERRHTLTGLPRTGFAHSSARTNAQGASSGEQPESTIGTTLLR
jgi:hypothetical protein